MTHTPGPWKWNVPAKEKHVQARWITGNGFFIAKAYGHDGQPVDDNARLIATAPDMYEEGKDLLIAIKVTMNDLPLAVQRRVKRLEAIYAEAEGR